MDSLAPTSSPPAVDLQRHAQLRQERDRFVALAFCAADVLFETDSSLTISFAAGATTALSGYRPEGLVGRSFLELVIPENRDLVAELCRGMRAGARLEPAAIRLRGASGPTPTLLMAGYHLPDLDSRYFFSLRLRAASILEDDSRIVRRDPETGLLERGVFAELAADRVARAAERGEALQLSFLHLESLGELRARLDQDTDSQLLDTVGACLRASAVDGEAACRFDGESYGLLHREAVDVRTIAERIETYARSADPRGVGIAVGAGTVAADPARFADVDSTRALMFALRQASRSEPESMAQFGRTLDKVVADTTRRMAHFRRIARGGDFEVAFQPIVHVGTRALHHHEALVRFDGTAETSPYEMITMAENTGLIAEFDLAMCRKVLAWIAASSAMNRTVTAAINLSGHSVTDAAFMDRLERLLVGHGDFRSQVLFEITESAEMRDLETTNRTIQRLRALGHKVCLDDFGAGAAALRYLQALDVDIVKIDGSYVRDAMTSAKNRAFLRAVVGLCRELGVATIAEMVEDEACLAMIRDCGVDLAQGYLFGRPSVVVKRTAAIKPTPEPRNA